MQAGGTITYNALLGAWQLQSWQLHNPGSGSLIYPFGEDAQGMLLYSPTGLVSASISRAKPAHLSTKPSSEELAAAYQSHLHYLAHFQLSADVVTHRVLMSSHAALVGHSHSRQISVLADGCLRYEGVDNPGSAQERRHIFIWQRWHQADPA